MHDLPALVLAISILLIAILDCYMIVSIKRNIKTNVSIMLAIIYNNWLIFYSLYYTLFSYLGTVLMFIFAAEAVNLFVR